MTFPSFPQQAGARPGGAAPFTRDGGSQRLALDNLIRRELKVGDPNDPRQIADALMNRYQNDPRARAMAQEALGLPALPVSAPQPAQDGQSRSSSIELQQATSDVDRDFQELLTNNLLKDITPELEAWSEALHAHIAQGIAAAGLSLDPYQRDQALAVRRQLGEYARLARLVGTLTPSVGQLYRKLAQSLDEVASVLLVLMGEALGNVGFNGGRYLLRAPYTELQTRRAAVLYALRNLTGAAQESYGQSEYPYGLKAYHDLYRKLEQDKQEDLRALLVESELARVMDRLIQLGADGSVRGLRSLGATAFMDLSRFRRLVTVANRMGNGNPPLPALGAFLESLLLFADAFEGSGGFRLLGIARPPILLYGLYGNTGLANADRRLLRLTELRGAIADDADAFLPIEYDPQAARAKIAIDYLVFTIDRAIDLYAVGTGDLGSSELRAAAYGFPAGILAYLASENHAEPGGMLGRLVEATKTVFEDDVKNDGRSDFALALRRFNDGTGYFEQTLELLYPRPTEDANVPPSRYWDSGSAIVLSAPATRLLLREELFAQRDFDAKWIDVVRTMAMGGGSRRHLEALVGSRSFVQLMSTVADKVLDVVPDDRSDPAYLSVDVRVPQPAEVSLEQLEHLEHLEHLDDRDDWDDRHDGRRHGAGPAAPPAPAAAAASAASAAPSAAAAGKQHQLPAAPGGDGQDAKPPAASGQPKKG